MFVKICGITNEDDALFAVAMGADAVGFIFAPSPGRSRRSRSYDITRRLPPEILTVGVFRDEPAEPCGRDRPPRRGQGGAAARARDAGADRRGRRQHPLGDQGLQRHLAELRKADRYGTDLVLVDAPAPGSGKLFDWGLASDVPPNLRG